MLHNIDLYYVEDSHFLINPNYDNINFKINIIFIINEKNINNYNINLLFLLKQQYNNYNIIIFLNNVDVNNLEKYKSSNIYIFKSNNTLTNIEIIISLTQLASNNSLILIIDNDYLINPMFSLEFINKLFFSKKILVTDYYSNTNINILIFKKELLSELEILDKNNNIEYMNLLYIFLKEKSFSQYFLKEYNFTYIDKKYFIKKEYNLINNYYDYFFDNYSD